MRRLPLDPRPRPGLQALHPAFIRSIPLDDTALVAAHSGPTGEDAWVFMTAGRRVEVRIPDWNGGEPGCWEVSFADVECDLGA